MKKCIIFCAGGFDAPAEPICDGDLVIAADGGLVHAQRLGIEPHVILGDFDSLGYVPQGAQVFPVEKDDTDAMLAVKQGLAQGCRRFILYGGMDGARTDHTLANLQTLLFLARQGASGCLVGSSCIAAVVKDGALTFPAHAKGVISVFCLGAQAEGVTVKGLQYPLSEGTLTADFPLGVSNHFVGETAEISVKSGSLLVLYERNNGIIHREAALC